jgi:D-hydroxyproline dehydrogenase
MAKIAVIGAGIIGTVCALRLAEDGHAVTIIAPADAPHAASTGNAGTIAEYAVDPVGTPAVLRGLPRLLLDAASPLAIHRRSALRLVPWLARFAFQSLPGPARRNAQALVPLLAGAGSEWRALAAQIGATDLLRDAGAAYLFETDREVATARREMDARRALGAAVEILGRHDLATLEPGLPAGRFAGAAFFPGTLSLSDPGAMLSRLHKALAAQEIGRVVAHVTGIAPQGTGWRLTLDHGAAVTAEQLVLAAGAWSRDLARSLGGRIPLDTERGYHVEYDLPDRLIPVSRPLCPARQGFYLSPMAGRLRAVGTVELGGRDAPPSPHRWKRIEAGVRQLFPDLPAPARRWMGLRPSLPDSLPVIGAAPHAKGAILAFGHGHLGLTLAPRTAALVADLAAGRRPAIELSPYCPRRFRR